MAYNERSKTISQGIERSPNRAMFYGLGYTKEDFDNPMIGIANGHSTITPCNAGLQPLADVAVKAIKEAGAKFGIVVFGMRAVLSMRVVKNFATWLGELRPIYGPF